MTASHGSTLGRLCMLGAAAALAVTACAPSQGEEDDSGTTGIPDKIVIGSTLPLTGTESKTGGRMKQGYALAVELENRDGGIDLGGKKVPVELKQLDDTTDQAKAVNLAQRLITQDKVNFFLARTPPPWSRHRAPSPSRTRSPM